MGDKSKIEWTDATWNPIRARSLFDPGRTGWHCEHASEGCRNCYAEAMNRRLGTGFPFKPGHRRDIEIFLDDKVLQAPLRWKKPRRIFVCSMTDLFADFVGDGLVDRIFAMMALCPQHVFQVLTKRPDRMRNYFRDIGGTTRGDWVFAEMAAILNVSRLKGPSWPLPNVWLGTSAEDQPNLRNRIAELMLAPAPRRFLSLEPLLGPINLTKVDTMRFRGCELIDPLRGVGMDFMGEPVGRVPKIDWVIVGGESGPGARPMHPDWARSLRDQCAAAGTPFFFKQWGEWAPGECATDTLNRRSVETATWFDERWSFEAVRGAFEFHADDEPDLFRAGKKAAGRLLDGVLHDGMPA